MRCTELLLLLSSSLTLGDINADSTEVTDDLELIYCLVDVDLALIAKSLNDRVSLLQGTPPWQLSPIKLFSHGNELSTSNVELKHEDGTLSLFEKASVVSDKVVEDGRCLLIS